MASPEDHKHITTVLIPQLLERFNEWGREYQQPRDLGVRGEFVGLYRKARKLKTLLWDRRDGDPPPEQAGWREGPREIMMEVVAHGLLMLVDWDNAHPEEAPTTLGEKSDEDSLLKGTTELHAWKRDHAPDADAPNYEADSDEEDELTFEECFDGCRLAQRHTYGQGCALHNTEEGKRALKRMESELEEDYKNCGRCNSKRGHTYGHRCDKRSTKRKQRTGTIVMDDGGPFLEGNEEEVDELVAQRERERYQLRQMGDVDIADRIGGV